MSQNVSRRKPAMDIIRCFALLFVNSVHFFLNTGFYQQPVVGPRMYAATMIRAFLMICVPLFMLLSGYLMCTKKLEKKYYTKLPYTLIMYLLATTLTFFFRGLYLGNEMTLKTFLLGVFDYSGLSYSWYVEMYIGLFLLCPFLNVTYQHLNNRKEKLTLIATMLLLTSLPRLLNTFVPELAWFAHPTSSTEYAQLLPAFWLDLYPIAYYFIGCYLREYKLKLRCRTIALLSGAVFVLDGLFNIYRADGGKFIWGAWQKYGSPLILIQAVLFFAFFDNLNYDKFPPRLARFLQKLSELSFGAYLVSGIFDKIVYAFLNDHTATARERMLYFPLTVAIVFISSLLTSWVLNKLYTLLSAIWKSIKNIKLRTQE